MQKINRHARTNFNGGHIRPNTAASPTPVGFVFLAKSLTLVRRRLRKVFKDIAFKAPIATLSLLILLISPQFPQLTFNASKFLDN